MFFLKNDDKAQQDSEFHWYNERVNELLWQRKILIYINILEVFAIAIIAFFIFKVSQLRRFDPLVIKIEENTGQTLLIKPLNKNFLDSKDNLTRYFIKKYIIAREGYNYVDFNSYSRNIIASLSSENVYSQYLGYIKSPENDPVKKYEDRNSTYVTIKSWSKLDSNKYIVRFSVTEALGGAETINKVAIVENAYIEKQLTEQETDINPVGFTIVGYKVTDDDS